MKKPSRFFKSFFRRGICPTERGQRSVFFFIFLFSFVFCQPAQAQVPAESNSTEVAGNYRIGVGDVLKIVVFKQDLLSMDGVRVANDGTIKMPVLKNEIPAACRTEAQLAALLTNQYREYLLDPQVYVAVKEYNSNPVSVLGAVLSPGRFQLQRPMRLLELLTYVNGPSPVAGKNVQIIRSPDAAPCEQTAAQKTPEAASDEPPQEVISLPLEDVMKGDETANLFVRSGDIVRIGEAEQSFAFVIGSVKSAVTVNLKEPVTLTRAIAMAGGVAPGANVEKIKISRQAPGSLQKTEIVVNLKSINNRKREDVLLQADDIIDVPGESGTRKFLKDIFRAVIPTVTRLPIVIP